MTLVLRPIAAKHVGTPHELTGVFEDDRLVAVADLVRGHPNEHTAYIGLLELHSTHQGRALDEATYELLQQYVEAAWPEIRTLSLAVVDTTYEKQLTWAHPGLVVRNSPVAGKGLFATEPIAQSTVVGQLSGRRVTTAELAELMKNPPVDTITIDDDEHLVLSTDPRPKIAFGNHSCDPNMWWTDAVTLEARRDIAAGDELTSDYGTSTGVDFEMTCTCGSPLCRGVVTGEDWRRPELQARYGDHWIPVLLRKQRAG